jgi:transcriptional regulator with XRE-family HTH domain
MNIVKELMERKGIQQKELAMSVGVSQPTVSDWVRNRKDPKGENLEKVAAFFGVTTQVVRGLDPIPGSTPKYKMTEEEREIWELREQVRRDPERHYLFSLAKNANIDDVRQAVAIIDALKKTRGGD